jgi:hypothetical protein
MTVTQYMIQQHNPSLALMEELVEHFGDLQQTEEQWHKAIIDYLSK